VRRLTELKDIAKRGRQGSEGIIVCRLHYIDISSVRYKHGQTTTPSIWIR